MAGISMRVRVIAALQANEFLRPNGARSAFIPHIFLIEGDLIALPK